MKFRKKHPYLFWQMIGFVFVGAVIFHMLYALHSGWNDSFIVVMLMVSCLIIIGSPLMIRLLQKNEQEQENESGVIDNAIFEYHVLTKGHASEVAVIALLFAIPLAGTMYFCYVGLPFLFPITLYLDVLVYQMWKVRLTNRFYRYKDGEKKCRVIEASDEEIEKLCLDNAVSYIHEPDEDFLRFLYNLVRGKSELSDDTLEIYSVSAERVNELYGTELDLDSKPMLCIPSEVVQLDEMLALFKCSYVCLRSLVHDDANMQEWATENKAHE